MQITGAVTGNVPADFFRSLGDHEELQTHAPEDFDYDQAATDLLAAQTALAAAQVNINLKAVQTALDATNATVLTKAPQSGLDLTNAAIATKAAQADMVDVENALQGVEQFVDNADDYFDFTNRLFRDEHTEALIVKNLRVLATDDFDNSSTHHNQFDDPIPDPGLKGLFFTEGTFTEVLRLMGDARVTATNQQDDPAENDSSQLQQGCRFGGVNAQTTLPDRDQHDGLDIFTGNRRRPKRSVGAGSTDQDRRDQTPRQQGRALRVHQEYRQDRRA